MVWQWLRHGCHLADGRKIDAALVRVMVGLLSDDTELFKQFQDNDSFRRWLTDTVFGLTYEGEAA